MKLIIILLAVAISYSTANAFSLQEVKKLCDYEYQTISSERSHLLMKDLYIENNTQQIRFYASSNPIKFYLTYRHLAAKIFNGYNIEITQGGYVEDSVEYVEEGNLLKVSVHVSKKRQLLLKGTEDSDEDLDEGGPSKESNEKLLLEGAEGSVELFDKDNLSKVVRVAKEKQVFNDVVIMVDNEKKDFILVFFNDELVLECEIKPLDLDYSKKNEKQVVTKGRRKPAPKPGTFDDSGLGLKYISFASPENGKLATFFYGCVSE